MRVIEGLALSALVLLGTQLAFTTGRPIAAGAAAISPTPLVIVLPLLLWAALRFGTSGASLALLATALSAVEGAIARVHAADLASAEQAVLSVQVFLIMLAVPLLGFAALIEERYRARLDLAERLRFEAMLARLSATFVGVAGSRMPDALLSAVERLGRFVGAEAAVLFEPPRTPGAAGGHSSLVTVWTASDALRSDLARPHAALPWVVEQVEHERVVVGHAATPPIDEAADDRALLARHRIESLVALPVYQGSRVVGGLVLLLNGRGQAPWSADEIGRVRQASTVLGQALGHWRTDEALRESESVKAAILGAIATGVAVLSREGRIISTNAQWDLVAGDRTLTTVASVASGDFLEWCRTASGLGLPVADDAREGVGGVLDGSRARFVADYCAVPASADRWFTLLAVPLPNSDGGALVTHAETTERRRAELTAQRSRDELAHVARMSAMGELATSLAQRLSEPLSSIVDGADAARTLLSGPVPDLPALDGLLQGIIDHDRRASDVIEQLRALLHKGDSPRVPVDVNAIVEDIAELIGRDAADRHVQVAVALDPEPLVISADRVRIAQVLLNLALNAMDAMESTPVDRRHLRFATEGGYGAAVVIVSDTGPGVPANTETLFAPFHTTKTAGMGMGLAIARTIVESHGGRIWGAPTPGAGGASFFVSLPLAE
jgi:signal transduction histidine kinase